MREAREMTNNLHTRTDGTTYDPTGTIPMHAHVHIDSRDCDGRYERSYVVTPEDGQDMYAFQGMVMGWYMPLDYRGDDTVITVQMSSRGFDFLEPTDEGYRAVDVTWCTGDDVSERGTFRDYTAESMGY